MRKAGGGISFKDIFLEFLHHGLSKSAMMYTALFVLHLTVKRRWTQLIKQSKFGISGRRIATVRRGASLVFPLVGAGVGAMIFRPLAGQWIGCAIGDLAGPIIVSFWLGESSSC